MQNTSTQLAGGSDPEGLRGTSEANVSISEDQKGREQASNMRGTASDRSPSTIGAGQQVSQSQQVSLGSSNGSNPSNEAVTRQMPQAPMPSMEGVIIRDQGSRNQPDMMGLMSQVLDTPAFSGILSDIAGQTGVGSADDLRGIFQQLNQSAEARNTINQLAQQVTREDVSSMYAGSGRGQDGPMDFSSMFEQMMPVVSRALAGNSSQTDSFITVERNPQPGPTSITHISEIDIQEAVQRINTGSPPQDIFRAVLLASFLHGEAGSEELVDELCADEDLAKEFMEALSHDLQGRLQSASS